MGLVSAALNECESLVSCGALIEMSSNQKTYQRNDLLHQAVDVKKVT